MCNNLNTTKPQDQPIQDGEIILKTFIKKSHQNNSMTITVWSNQICKLMKRRLKIIKNPF